MDESQFRGLIARGLDGVAAWEHNWRPFETAAVSDVDAATAEAAIDALVERLRDNYPFFHPDYAGQMLKPPHPVALAAYLTAARINPNNHALDGGPATAALERECVAQIAQLFGYDDGALGHLTSSGTIANLEALWVASRLHPGKRIAFSSEAHYTHARMCEVLGVETVVLPVDARGRLDVDALRALNSDANIGTVVVTPGTTAAAPSIRSTRSPLSRASAVGACTPTPRTAVFIALIADLPEARMRPQTWAALRRCDSIVVDPHKHGLQPYGCGCVLFADPSVGALYKHDSPYTYFTSAELHLGEISLECSRAGAVSGRFVDDVARLAAAPPRGPRTDLARVPARRTRRDRARAPRQCIAAGRRARARHHHICAVPARANGSPPRRSRLAPRRCSRR